MFILKCADCQQQVNISPVYADSVVNCPVCGKGIRVPATPAPTPAPAPAPAPESTTPPPIPDWAKTSASSASMGGDGAAKGPSMNFSPAWSTVSGTAQEAKQSFRSTMNPPPGQNWGMVPPGTQPAASRLVYILLAIFLGTLGIHNFVIGLTGRGVTQLAITLVSIVLLPCTFGISTLGVLATFIWSLVDIVTIKNDSRGVTLN